MNNLKTFFLFFFAQMVAVGSAQILPPVFDCIRGDTLYWTPTLNSCGPFVSVDIYRSSSVSGPFSLLASVTDPNRNSFHDPAIGDSYYYLLSNHTCAGQMAIPSDTLNNLAPAITTLEKVTVQSDGVLVSWYDNMDKKTVAYIIYRSTNLGTVPIDTVFGALQYLDRSSDALNKSESYYVLAMDQCGNTGFFDMPHQTIHLTTKINFCEQYVELNWNNYAGWQNGTENVQIWLALDGAPLAFEHQVQLTDTLAYVTGIEDNREYCIAIVSKENGRDVLSMSNTQCAISDVIQPVDELVLRNVTVNDMNQVELSWYISTIDSDIDSLLITRQEGNNPFNVFLNLSDDLPFANQVISIDQAVNTAQSIYTYQLQSVDDCETEKMSGTINTMVLKASSTTAGENNLEWSPWKASARMLIEYQICRQDSSGLETTIATIPENMVTYSDLLPDPDQGTFCYIVKAVHVNQAGTDTLVSRSNKACIEPTVGLYIPNAFVPDGLNNIFRPYASIENSIRNYRMQIFNRWGGKVFESENIFFGWDGKQEGRSLNPGVFFYLITFDQPDGESEQHTGTLNLIR